MFGLPGDVTIGAAPLLLACAVCRSNQLSLVAYLGEGCVSFILCFVCLDEV